MARMTQAEFDALPQDIRDRCTIGEVKSLLYASSKVELPKAKGRAPSHTWGVMNESEKRFAGELASQKEEGKILWFGFELWTFRLAEKLRFTPDFVAMKADGFLVCYEVKAERTHKTTGKRKVHYQDDSLAKLKMAAAQVPIQFVAVAWSRTSGWQYRNF